MTTLDSDFAFGKMFRKATAADFGLRQEHDAFADTDADGSKARGGMAALSIFAGLGIMSAVIFTTGYLALLSDTPAIWIHRLMALTVAQSILISAVAMKLLPLIERRRLSVRIITDARANRVPPLLDQSSRTNEAAATRHRYPSRLSAANWQGASFCSTPTGRSRSIRSSGGGVSRHSLPPENSSAADGNSAGQCKIFEIAGAALLRIGRLALDAAQTLADVGKLDRSQGLRDIDLPFRLGEFRDTD